MLTTIKIPESISGLTEAEVAASRRQNGSNEQLRASGQEWWQALLETLKEPMLILLVAVTIIYFSMKQNREAYFMLAAIVMVSGISFYQDTRSRKAMEALQKINAPLSKVIRDSQLRNIPTKEIVVGDMLQVEEGNPINADGKIVHSNDFSVNESMLTGEAYAVFKSADDEDNQVFSGTLVVSGLAIYQAEKIGNQTKIGKLGDALVNIKEGPTPLQLQIQRFVKVMTLAGFIVFLLVWLVRFLKNGSIPGSLLEGLTLAMSVLPEEIPVAFTTFMALGSWRLMQLGIIVKKTRTVETLGSATVICTDKTGTITENRMSLQSVYVLANHALYENETWKDEAPIKVIRYAMWASEPVPFDPMEKTLHKTYEAVVPDDERSAYHMIHEYPLNGKPPMMTHLFENQQGNRIIAAKGAPEAIFRVCTLSETDKKEAQEQVKTLAEKGYRILGVAASSFKGNDYPGQQQQLPFLLLGLVAFYDPPKTNISSVFGQFYEAGISIKIITGDNAATTRTIAKEAGLQHAELSIDGEELMKLPVDTLQLKLKEINIFSRMFPEAKLVAINALKEGKEIVAMIGDGVNDGPALKAAHIGVAMGRKGTEMAKQAAALILVDDDLSKLVDAVAMGRRIYTNLKKAVQYIISIHIPIILTVSLPLFLGWIYPVIFTPMHVIFLELVMGPTCSIVYESEPIEKNAMKMPPRALTTTFLSLREMSISIVQGLLITAGVLFIYQLSVNKGFDEVATRTMVFCTLVLSNIFLTLVNRSFYYSFLAEMKNKNNLMVLIIAATLVILAGMLYIPAIASFFKIAPLSFISVVTCTITALLSVGWFEVWKWVKRKRNGNYQNIR